MTTAKLKSEIRHYAREAEVYRASVERSEQELQHHVSLLIQAHDGGLRAWSRSIGISAAYAHDLLHGRRKVSQAILDKILK